MLENLTKLAEVESSEKRRELMSGIATLFISNKDNISDNENSLFGDILTKLLNVIGDSDKVDIANDFAETHNVPIGFAMALAQEAPNVATPILTKSRVFSDQNLVEISENTSQNHRLAISNREQISSYVTDSLISFGENVVLRSISVNEGAQVSHSGLRKMVEHSEGDKTLLSNIINRDGLFDQLKSVAKTLAKSAQMRLAKLLADEHPEKLSALMQIANKHLAKDRSSHRADQNQAKTDLQHIADGTLDKDDVVMEFARKDKPLKIATLFASFTDLKEKYIANSMLQINADALIVMCKSADVGVSAVREIAEMRCRILRTPSSSVEKFVKDFMELDENDSQRTMRFANLEVSSKNKAQAY
ncbi:MAG: DUF2336 domain-containing protein [Alphaproteobacteria bacterium]|nr:DUF2336 domain-containing protein [Alphaproteobacteria bacterium]